MIAAIFCIDWAAADDRVSSCHPVQLRTEYLVTPLGLDAAQPRLTWVLIAPDKAPRHLDQVSYQILVASSPEVLATEKGDIWDSGVVKSGETANIPYDGPALSSRQRCFWKVRITDSLGATSAWSEPASWEMGLLKPEDWQAKWIEAEWMPNQIKGVVTIKSATYAALDGTGSKDVTEIVKGKLKDGTVTMPVNNTELGGDPTPQHAKQLRVTYTLDGKNLETAGAEGTTLCLPGGSGPLPYLRKDFTVQKTVARARLYATALGIYELRLNGQRVGDHLFAPDWTDYSKRLRYQDYDVTSLVKSGANTLGALVANGWYSGHIGNGGYQAWGKTPALFAQLEVTYEDGTVERVVTDASWKIHPGPILSADNMLGENYDAQREIEGWDQPGLDVSKWIADTERTESPRPLDGQVDQPVREIARLRPKTIKEGSPGHWIVDFGQNMVGVLRVTFDAAAGTKITLRHAEMLNPDGSVYTQNLRGATAKDTYICKGGKVTWQPSFTFHGFRYAEISGLTEAPTPDTVTGIVIGTDIPRAGEFSSSNADINQLQSNIQWGMRGNYLSVPTDCPQRDERMGWMGDAQVFIRTAAYNGDIAAFFTKWLVDVDDAQNQEGWFSDVCPMPSTHNVYGYGGVPAWGDAGVICPWTIYLMYGDKRILQQHLPAMTRWVDYCVAHSDHFIRSRDRGHDYGDWLSQGENTSKELIATAYLAYSTSLVAKSYAAVGDTANAEKYGQLFEKIKTAFDQRYIDADGRIKDGTQCAYCMALRFDLLPEELRAQAAHYLDDDVKAHDDHLTTGFVGVSYLLPVLTAADKLDTAYKLFLQDTFPSWLFSVKHGATTIWERWDGWTPEKGFQNPGMNSFNHYSLGSCGQWMFETVAGISVDPAQPGFRHFIIRPRPGGDFTHAGGSYNSIHGKIVTNWKVAGNQFSLHVVVPVNTTATIELPVPAGTAVQEGGHDTAKSIDIQTIAAAGGTAQFVVGSGSYNFTCPMP